MTDTSNAPVLFLETLRIIFAFGGLALLLIWENVAPFRPKVDRLWRRYAINGTIAGTNALILSVLLSALIIAAHQVFAQQQWGLLRTFHIHGWLNVIVTVVMLDGVTYFWHKAYHQVPLLWRMHQVHHSDLDLDVTSSGRFHLFEMLLSALFRLLVIACVGAELASVIVFEMVFGLLNQIEHANLHLPEPLETWIRSVFVTPDMHRIHHDQRKHYTNSNYGTIFSFWDRLFGSYRFDADQQGLTIGLPEYPSPDQVTLLKVLRMPLN